MNEWDKLARGIIRQTRTPSQGTRMNASSGGQMQNTTSTMTDADGNPLRLWIPGVDPWGVPGYYFGNRQFDEKEIY